MSDVETLTCLICVLVISTEKIREWKRLGRAEENWTIARGSEIK
jgi:hypothetical protein